MRARATDRWEHGCRLAAGLLLLGALAGCASGPSIEETGPSLHVQMVVPPTFPDEVVAGGELILSAAGDEDPGFNGFGLADVGGVTVAFRTADLDGDGRLELIVSYSTNPLRQHAAEIYLYAKNAARDAGAFVAGPAIKLEVKLFGSAGEEIARGNTSLDRDGEAIRFGPSDRSVLVSLACVSAEACNAPVATAAVDFLVTRAANCPGTSALGTLYVLLDPSSASGEAVLEKSEQITLLPGVPVALNAKKVVPGIYRARAVLDTSGQFEARGRIEGDGDLVSSVGQIVNVSTLRTERVSLVLDRVSGVGPCLGGLIGSPILVSTMPASPANDTNPRVRGTALPGGTVRLHADALCATPALGEGPADGSGSFEIPISVADDSTTTFWATVTDLDGNVSACGGGTLTYIEDSLAPTLGMVAAFSTEPPSPSTVVVPLLRGTIEAGASAAIHLAGDCGDSAVATGSAAELAFGLRVPVPANATASISVRLSDAAGNVSGCLDTGVRYRHDVVPPEGPTSIVISPTGPSTDQTPFVQGSVEAGATVQVYPNGSCTGTPVTATAAAFAAGIPVPVSPNATTTFSVRVTDAAGNPSSCVPLGVTYVHDAQPLGLPASLASDPAGVSSIAAPTIRGLVEPGATVAIHTASDCSDTPVIATATELSDGVAVMVPTNQTTTLSFVVTDDAGNVSSCLASSLTYIHDGIAPSAPALTGTAPVSPSILNDLAVQGTAEPGATVRLFINARCAGLPAASGVTDGTGAFSIAVVVGDNTQTSFFATATDPAGNASPCSASSATYFHDVAGPQGPFNVVRTRGNRQVQLDWAAAVDVPAGVASYEVAWCAGTACTPPASPQVTGLSPSTLTQTVTGLVNCTEHGFFVRGVDTLGNAGQWVSLTDTPLPAAPPSISAVASPGKAELSWGFVNFATSYEVCYSASRFACNSGTVHGQVTSRQAVVSPVPFGTRYYAVRALDGTCAGLNSTDADAPAPTVAGASITNGGSGANRGLAIVVPGDLDGDGKDDVVFGDPYPTRTTSGGNLGAHSPGRSQFIWSLGGFTYGTGSLGLGRVLAAAGDLDGDGRPDILAGASTADNPAGGTGNGAVFFVSGRAGTVIRQIFGDAGEGLGRSLAGIHDLDADGTADAVAGGLDRVRLLSGATGNTIASIPSAEPGDGFGTSVAAIGLVGGNPRYVVGAPGASPPGGASGAGSAYIFEGTSSTPIARVNGAVASGGFGQTVAATGDVNGDGVPDFLVAAPASSGLQRLFVYSGQDAALLYTIDRRSASDELGASAAPAGDVDGDGRADFIVGAPGMNRAFVFSGIDGRLLHELIGSNGRFGASVAAGDGNGDGRVDFYVGAPTQFFSGGDLIRDGFVWAFPSTGGLSVTPAEPIDLMGAPQLVSKPPPVAFAGSTVTFTGGTNLAFSMVTSNSGSPSISSGAYTPGATPGVFDTIRIWDLTTGESIDVRVAVQGYANTRQYSGNSATAVAAGDVDGDGKSDAIVGAAFASPGGLSFAGNITVYSGATGAVIHTIDGTVADQRLGAAVAGMGDLNGDGRADFAAGASRMNGVGQVTVYSGMTGAALYTPIDGTGMGSDFGSRVAAIGDVDGDGKSDLLVSAPFAANTAGNSSAGVVYLYSGATGVFLRQIEGTEAFQRFGQNVAVGGDLDKDGIPDFVVGVPDAFESAGFAAAYSGAFGTKIFQINGGVPGDDFGQSVAILPDLNQDGYDEIIVGAATNNKFTNRRRLHVYSGFDRQQFYESFTYGPSIAVLGDVDGDGFADFVAGEPMLSLDRGVIRLYSGADGIIRFSQFGSAQNERLGNLFSTAGDANGDGVADFLAVGNQPSGGTATLWTSQVPPPPPARPTSLAVAALTTSQAMITWVDNATNETGFKVESRAPRSTWSQAGSAAADATGATVFNLAPGSSYYIRVKAVNATGDSAWSPQLLVTTPAQ